MPTTLQDQDSPGPRKPAPSPKSVSVSSDGIKHKTVKHSPGCDSPLARAPPWRGSCSNVIEVTEDNILVSLDKTVKAASRCANTEADKICNSHSSATTSTFVAGANEDMIQKGYK